jgi:hypothetical protein
MEKQRLEMTQKIRDIELDILLARLEMEMAINKARLEASGATPAQIKEFEDRSKAEIDLIKQKHGLEKELLDEQIRGLNKYGSTLGEIISGGLAKAVKGLFGKKDKKKDEPAISDEATNKTIANAQKQGSWLDNLSGKMGAYRDVVFAVGDAIMAMEELSLQAILKALKAELDALAKKALIKALEYAAIAAGALVMGDFGTAKKAGIAAAAWGAVAVAAKAGSALVGLGIKDDTAAGQKASDTRAGTSSEDEKRKRIARMQAEAILVKFDIRMDEGVLLEKQVRALNMNTRVTTVTDNARAGFMFPPT